MERWDTRHVYGHATTLYSLTVGIERTDRHHPVCVHKAAHPPVRSQGRTGYGFGVVSTVSAGFQGGQQAGNEVGRGVRVEWGEECVITPR